ncbi:uncharacterized protein LOC135383558 [Ornithodoros turicata]|uniref:uncharacterized protein LOC135383558 n=1 Tax=Ornithodoros turicata TaxID=34597 RepID=UPI00313A415D
MIFFFGETQSPSSQEDTAKEPSTSIEKPPSIPRRGVSFSEHLVSPGRGEPKTPSPAVVSPKQAAPSQGEGGTSSHGKPNPQSASGLESNSIIGVVPQRHNNLYYLWYSSALLLGSLAVPLGLLIMAFVRGRLATKEADLQEITTDVNISTTDYLPNVPEKCLQQTVVTEPDPGGIVPVTSFPSGSSAAALPFFCAYETEVLLPTPNAIKSYGYFLPRHLNAEFCPFILYEFLVPRHASYSTLQPQLEAKSGLREILSFKNKSKPWEKTKVVISVGGHPEDQIHFASLVKVRGRMREFTLSLITASIHYKASGINIDWKHLKDSDCTTDQHDNILLHILEDIRAVSDFNNRPLLLSVSLEPDLARNKKDIKPLEALVDYLLVHTHRLRPSTGPCLTDSTERNSLVKEIVSRMADSSKLCVSFSMLMRGQMPDTVQKDPTPAFPYSRTKGLATPYDICSLRRTGTPKGVPCDDIIVAGSGGRYEFGWDGAETIEKYVTSRPTTRPCVVYRDLAATDFLSKCTVPFKKFSNVFQAYKTAFQSLPGP